MAVRSVFSMMVRLSTPGPVRSQLVRRSLNTRANSTAVAMAVKPPDGPRMNIESAMPNGAHSAKIIFQDNRICDFKFIWLRDNCKCGQCVHTDTRQKILDSPMLDAYIQPQRLTINDDGNLVIDWPAAGDGLLHRSVYDARWLHKQGQCFAQDTFTSAVENSPKRPELELWDRTKIWSKLPEISYREFMGNEDGLLAWLGMIHKYGVAIMREVPTTDKNEVVNVVKRFAYVKETSYGITFDVISKPDPRAHLAYTGRRLELHTDMNYREKSPGLQLLHCLESESGGNAGGKSFFVDGFFVSRWLQDNQPAAFHILASTPVEFCIRNQNLKYSQHWPIICTDKEGDTTEIHHNNRTMGPLQSPAHIVLPFYHAYRLFTEKLREPACELVFQLAPGDLVAFNNRRVLHGRMSFDHTQVNRHLKGCYVDIDEAMSLYDHFLSKSQGDDH